MPFEVTRSEDVRDRPFNGFRIAKTEQARKVVSIVRDQVQSYEMCRVRSRKRRPQVQNTFDRQIESLVCDLAHREIIKPNAWLALPFSKQVLGRKDRYRPAVLSETLPTLVRNLASFELELVEIIKGAHCPFNPALSRQTAIRAGRRLKDAIKEYGLVLNDFKLDKTQEIIILKDNKEDHWDTGKWLQYEDTPQTITYRSELQRINEWLEQADIDYIPPYETNTTVDTTDLRLRRYFNNNCFEHGGRLFGGFWQNMSRMARKGIVIDGMRTITLDYGQMIARVLYGLVGAPFDFSDAYRVPGLEGYRDGVKKVFSAMLYADGPLKRMPQGCRDLFPKRFSYAEVADKVKNFHHAVSEFLYTGTGPSLTYQESNIILIVLTKLMEHGVTALPIHDAVIVAYEHQSLATRTMLEVFKEVTGIDGVVSFD